MTDAPIAAFKDICVDAGDAGRSAQFWAAALGLRMAERRGAIVRLDGRGPHVMADPGGNEFCVFTP
jgi:hypothetical protein